MEQSLRTKRLWILPHHLGDFRLQKIAKDRDIGAIFTLFNFSIVGGFVGWFAWGHGPAVWRLVSILILPLAWGQTRSRWSATMLMVGYYLSGGRSLPGGSVVFFGDTASAWLGWSMWASASVLLAIPFAILWTAKKNARAWRFAAAVCVSTIPPLAIIGWVSPLAVAGVLFPGLGWAGLVFTLAAMVALALRKLRWIVVLGVAVIIANATACFIDVVVPAGWIGVDTTFSRLSGAGTDDAGQLLATMQRVEWMKQFALTVPANSVRVFPETVLGSFDGVASFALLDTEAALRARGSRLLVGAELPQSDGRYKNSVLVLGAGAREVRSAMQNIPVPISMWKPWTSDGAVANLFGRENLIKVGDVRAGVVICYEQALAFSILWVITERPDLIVAVSNVWWARDTSIPDIQRQTVNAFGRLFGIGVVAARNF